MIAGLFFFQKRLRRRLCYREHNSVRGECEIEMDRFLQMRKLSPD
jgi:hypothetical protein